MLYVLFIWNGMIVDCIDCCNNREVFDVKTFGIEMSTQIYD